MELAKIGIVMELPFSEFGADRQAEFVADLARVSGCLASDIRDFRFWRGCVKFEARMDPAAFEFLLECYRRIAGASDVGDVPSGMVAVAEFLEKYNITMLSDGVSSKNLEILVRSGPDREKLAIFVHGWSGAPASFGELPRYIQEEAGIETKIYQYPTSKFGDEPALYYVSQNLDNWIRNIMGDQACDVALLGHSMGGLVIRKMLGGQLARERPIDKCVRQITFIASPLSGAWLANATAILPAMQKKQASEMSTNSASLAEITSNWHAWVNRLGPAAPPIRSIYGTNDKIVDPTSAMGGDAGAVPILGADHTGIVKAHAATDEIVRTLVRFLKEADMGSVRS